MTFPLPSHYLPPQNSGPCNSFYCLGHFKNVYDDDETNVNAARTFSICIAAFISFYFTYYTQLYFTTKW